MNDAAALPDAVPPKPESFFTRLVGWLLTLTALLLPCKFGTVAVITDAAGYFPEEWSDYFWITWPAHSFGIVSGLLLVLVLAAKGRDFAAKDRARTLFFWLWGVGLFAAALPGFLGRDVDMTMAFSHSVHFAGIGAWALAAGLFLESFPRWGKWMTAGFFAGAIWVALGGYHQYFFGFAEMREFIAKLEEQNVPVQDSLVKKLADTRISGALSSSNALSGLLLMAMPLAFYFGGSWGKRFEPVSVSVKLFRILGLGVLLGALILTRARSGILALSAAGTVAVFSSSRIRKPWKIATAVLLVAVIAGTLIFAIKMGRGLNSMMERPDYMRTSMVLLKENPLCGSGWGGFFYRHMEMKKSLVVEAARDPHNIILAFAGQCGLLSGIVVVLALLLPLKLLWKRRFSGFSGAVFWSGVMFTVHIMVDSDMMVVPLMAGMFLLYATALTSGEEEKSETPVTAKMSWRYSLLVWSAGAVMAGYAVYGNWYHLAAEKALAKLIDVVYPNCAGVYCDDMVLRERFEAASRWRKDAISAEIAGDWQLRNGNLAAAEEYYIISLSRNPRRPAAYRRMADLALLRGDEKEWRRQMAEAEKRFPRHPLYRVGTQRNREHISRLLESYSR